MPHQRPTDKEIGPGELVVIDSGAKYAGYHADMTRTVATKGYSEQQKDIYNIVDNLLSDKQALETQVTKFQGIISKFKKTIWWKRAAPDGCG